MRKIKPFCTVTCCFQDVYLTVS